MIDLQEIEERIAKCEKILDANPGSQIFAALAEAHRKKGDLDKAFQVCQKGLKTHPDYGSAHLVMAKINLDKGLFDWADTEVEKAAKLGGNVHKVEALRCEIMVSKGQFADAAERIKKQLQRDPANEGLRKLLEVAERAVRPSGAAAARSSQIVMPMTEVVGERMAVAPPPMERPRLTAEEFLREGVSQSGAFGGLRMDFDGNQLDSEWNNVGSEKECAALVGELMRLTGEALARVDFGAARATLMETDALAVYMLMTDREAFAFAAGEGVNANRMRAAINHLYRDYENAARDRSE
ncbi:MAG TPA: tetratricopeptide repeat protein [candidate division Zixibacteria bacterium]|nr:tetratricopeptide repeat protein [candidate division Zixibacteria bacterium]